MNSTFNFDMKSRFMKKLVFGMMVIIFGLLLLARNLNLLSDDVRHVIFSFPMLLVAIGVVNLFGNDSWLPGVLITAVGAFFLLPRIFYIPFDLGDIFWPGVIILVGSLLIYKSIRGDFQGKYFKHDRRWYTSANEGETGSGYLEETSIFGGSKKIVTTQQFKGGKVVAIFGGADVDLTQANLAPGTHVLEITCVFGGVNLRVPSTWSVHLEVDNILGGFEDKRYFTQRVEENPDAELIIRGAAVFGGGELKS